MSTNETPVRAFHFLRNDRKLGYGDGRKARDGETLSYTDHLKPAPCLCGMHASIRVIDALGYAPGTILCNVEVWGDVATDNDKLVGRHRKILWSIDATRILQTFAIDCAERAIARIDNPDPRSVRAIDTARRYLAGSATVEALGTARKAARAAAYAADAAAADAAYAAYAAADAAYAAYAAADAAYAACAARAAAARAARAAAADAADGGEHNWQESRLQELVQSARFDAEN